MNKILVKYFEFCSKHTAEIYLTAAFLVGVEIAKRSDLRKREVEALEKIAQNLNGM